MGRMLIMTKKLDERRAVAELFSGAKGETVQRSMRDVLGAYDSHAEAAQ